ncbi:MAG: DNA-protecting protein DprA [Clostridiales bacterium]|nr:DNA-protecting protein DprA [Clostridiales bacterium]
MKLLLLERFGSPENIYYAEKEDLLLTEEMRPSQAAILENKSLQRADEILGDCERLGIHLLTLQDAAYPGRLKCIYDPPVLLYWRGRLPLFDEEAAVAVVGTRRCTPYGLRTAESLGWEMTKQGALVVSGLAKGIDSAAHRGALRAGGMTAAVLGGGIDVIYPAENRWLYEDVERSGVLLSEYPPGTEAIGSHFPVRNRIISGLSLATVVVEAPERSGALITANTALEQGREVFAVPGPLDAPDSRGCNALIRDGAGIVTGSWDILCEYQARYPHKLRQTEQKMQKMPEKPVLPPAEENPAKTVETRKVIDTGKNQEGLTDDQIRIMRILSAEEGLLSDEVAEKAELPIRRVLSALTVLEIDGFAVQQGGRRFVRTVDVKE